MILDLSQYDLATLDAECMKAEGITGAILGVFSGSNSPEGMSAAAEKLIAAGVPVVGFYGLIYFGSAFGETRDTGYAITLAKRFNVSRVWLDCEIDAKDIGFSGAGTPTATQRVAAIRESVRMVEDAGLKAGIYTGAWWWPSKTGFSTEFAHLPLWHAAYFNDGTKVQSVNYGGWTKVAIHQWTSTLPVCGRNRDANHVWDTSVIEEETMTKEEVEKLVNERLDAVLPAYYRRLTRLYWDRAHPDAYSDPPDAEVVWAIASASIPDHEHGGVKR